MQPSASVHSEKLSFPGSGGQLLAARLERPAAPPRAFAMFAHCFTCGKDVLAATRISRALARHGFGVLRFDFTGLGESEGDFAEQSFSSNLDDLVAAGDYLRSHHRAPQLLVGHSLGGAAVIACSTRLPEARAIVTIGAPDDPGHVERLLGDATAAIEREGRAAVSIAGRRFYVSRQFLEDVRSASLREQLAQSGRAFLFLHSPDDEIVGIESARRLFNMARHPKSFVSLEGADHLLSRRADARYVADVLAAWAGRYLDASGTSASDAAAVDAAAVRSDDDAAAGEDDDARRAPPGSVIVEERGTGRFAQRVLTSEHALGADEPRSFGGDETGPSPYELLLASLGACTSMTLRMYAERKGLALERVSVTLRHEKIHADDCADCETRVGKVDRIEREIELQGGLSDADRQRLLDIADKCPVHRTLHSEVVVQTRLSEPSPAPDDPGLSRPDRVV